MYNVQVIVDLLPESLVLNSVILAYLKIILERPLSLPSINTPSMHLKMNEFPMLWKKMASCG